MIHAAIMTLYPKNNLQNSHRLGNPYILTYGNVNWSGHCAKEYVASSNHQQQPQNYSDLVILLSDTHSKEVKSATGRHICTPMLIAELFTTVSILKQPKHPSVEILTKQLIQNVKFRLKKKKTEKREMQPFGAS